MGAERLRELEQAFLESRTVGDEIAWLREQARLGEELNWHGLALRHSPVELGSVLGALSGLPLDRFVSLLTNLPAAATARCMVTLVECTLSGEAFSGDRNRLLEALDNPASKASLAEGVYSDRTMDRRDMLLELDEEEAPNGNLSYDKLALVEAVAFAVKLWLLEGEGPTSLSHARSTSLLIAAAFAYQARVNGPSELTLVGLLVGGVDPHSVTIPELRKRITDAHLGLLLLAISKIDLRLARF